MQEDVGEMQKNFAGFFFFGIMAGKWTKRER